MSMPVDSRHESSLAEGLQRCRHLVAVMRGQIWAPSRKQQVMKQLVIVVSELKQRQQTKWWTDKSLLSPRQRYLRNTQGARIKIIQRRWRRHLLQKRILAKVRLMQKWENRQGVSCFWKSAVMIQRVFRGHFVRKHKIDIASYITGLVSRLDLLRIDREAYHLKCEHILQELQQIRLDIEVIRDKIFEEEKAVGLLTNKAAIEVNSSVVHEESVEYYKREVGDLEELARQLEKELQNLKDQEPVVYLAASLIQALYKGVRCRMERTRERHRQRQIYARMLHSKELCYGRMHSAWMIRNQKLLDANAKIIARLHHIHRAKCERENLRRDRAARKIEHFYRNIRARTISKQSLQWKKVKRQAKELALRKRHALMRLIWSGWLQCVQMETERRNLIAEHEAAGLEKWCNGKARRFLSAYRMRIAQRDKLEYEVMSHLDDRVRHHIRTAVKTLVDEPFQSSQEISSTFFLLIRNDVWTWRTPDKQIYFLARKYKLPLDALPLKQINLWLAEEAPGFVDLYSPFPTQTLLVLQHLSHYFVLHSSVLLQIQRVQEKYEARMIIREYLVLLYTANAVRLSPSTTYSSNQRQRAVDILREKDRVEYLSTTMVKSNVKTVQRDAFTTFYCLWNHHLCERCLAMRPENDTDPRQCNCHGHHYEANTVARDLYLETNKDTLLSGTHRTNPTRISWVSVSERCDFIVLNAFLHAIAPVNHENRRIHSLDILWKHTLSYVNEPLAELYKLLPTGSLNDLLNTSEGKLATWAKEFCPPDVNSQLILFISIMKEEFTQVDAQLSLEAQMAATVFCQQDLRPLRSTKAQNTMILTTNSFVKRKKNKRFVQSNGRLKPLVNISSAAESKNLSSHFQFR